MVRSSHILIACAAALLGIGVIFVHAAGSSVAGPEGEVGALEFGEYGPWAMFMTKNTLYAGIAIAVMIVASRINVRKLFTTRGWLNPLFLLILIALGLQAATLVNGVGHEVNGAARWLKVGSFTFQPSELVKWVLVLAIAWWCARRRGAMHKLISGVLPPVLLVGLCCAMIVKEDLGTGILVGSVAVVLLIAGGMRLWLLVPTATLAGIGIYSAIMAAPFRVQRLMVFRDPWIDPQGAGYHPIQSQLAFAQGGVSGSGLGNSIQKYYIPEDTTDFIFPIITEELGLVGAALVIGLFLAILWIGLGIVRDSKDTFGRLVGLGILVTIGAQAAINIAVVTVVVPTKGIALPLISKGGTGWIMTAFALGLVAALDNANGIEESETTGDDRRGRDADGSKTSTGGSDSDPDESDENDSKPALRLTA